MLKYFYKTINKLLQTKPHAEVDLRRSLSTRAWGFVLLFIKYNMKKLLLSGLFALLLLPSLTFASFDVSLKYGSRGQKVLELQDFLTEQGLLTAAPNGFFGLNTKKAVMAFQRSQGLTIDGYFGKGSRIKANEILANLLADSDKAEIAENGNISDISQKNRIDELEKQLNEQVKIQKQIEYNTQIIVQNTTPPSVEVAKEPEIKEITSEEMNSSGIYSWSGKNSPLWIATDGAQNGDKITLTIVGQESETKVVSNISGKNRIWSGWSFYLDETKEYPFTLKIERNYTYTIISLTAKHWY